MESFQNHAKILLHYIECFTDHAKYYCITWNVLLIMPWHDETSQDCETALRSQGSTRVTKFKQDQQYQQRSKLK